MTLNTPDFPGISATSPMVLSNVVNNSCAIHAGDIDTLAKIIDVWKVTRKHRHYPNEASSDIVYSTKDNWSLTAFL
jgi:hypothetical protein